MHASYGEVYEGTNRNLHARNTLIQLLSMCSDPERHNGQRYRQTDRHTNGRKDGRHDDANSRSYDHLKICGGQVCSGMWLKLRSSKRKYTKLHSSNDSTESEQQNRKEKRKTTFCVINLKTFPKFSTCRTYLILCRPKKIFRKIESNHSTHAL